MTNSINNQSADEFFKTLSELPHMVYGRTFDKSLYTSIITGQNYVVNNTTNNIGFAVTQDDTKNPITLKYTKDLDKIIKKEILSAHHYGFDLAECELPEKYMQFYEKLIILAVARNSNIRETLEPSKPKFL